MARRPKNRGQAAQAAQNRAERQNAQAQANLDSARQQAWHSFHENVSADRGAARYVKSSLKDTLGSLGDYGLGRYADDVRAELRSRLGDARNLVAFNRTAHRADLQDALAALADKQETLDLAVQSDERTAYHNIMDRIRDRAKREREQADAQAKRRRDFQRDLKKALTEIRNQVSNTRGPSPVAHQQERFALRRDPALRRALEDYLVSTQDVGPKVAHKAVTLYSNRTERGFDFGDLWSW